MFKIFCLLLLVLNSGCKERKIFNTEMVCPKIRILIRFAEAHEVAQAIKFSLDEKVKYESKENYTIIRMPGNRSFKIEKLPPEEAIKCQLYQIPVNAKFSDYEMYYH